MGAVVSDRGDAVEMVVTGAWDPDATATLRAGRVDRLVLNYALGFNEESLNFLRGAPIRELVLLDRRLGDLEPIYSLAPTLQALDLTTDPALTVDLSKLLKLRKLAAEWGQVSDTIDAATGLQTAYLAAYTAENLDPLAALTILTGLTVKDRPRLRSLRGLSELPELRTLGIHLAEDLADITDLTDRAELEDLALESCGKLTRLDNLAGCTGLRRLNISECGDIASLAPLAGMDNLETLLAFGSTNVLDGDLTPLAELPRLRELRMRRRRSYRPRVDDIKASLPRH